MALCPQETLRVNGEGLIQPFCPCHSPDSFGPELPAAPGRSMPKRRERTTAGSHLGRAMRSRLRQRSGDAHRPGVLRAASRSS